MAFLKKIKFGTGEPTSIAKTLVQGKPEGVISVSNTSGYENNDTEEKDYSYDIDVRVDDATIVKDGATNKVLKVGTVPAAQVSVAAIQGIDATNAQAAFQELKDDIDKVGGAAKSYTIVKETTGLETNVKEQYKLQQTVGKTIEFVGETIKIYKDSSLKSVALNGQNLDFTYILADGTESTVSVDVSTFLAESEFKNGLQVTNGEVSAKLGQGLEFGGETGEGVNQSIKVKVDSTSEKDTQSTPVDFLTVGTNGIKIQGIGAEIDRKIAALDVPDTEVDGQYVSQVSETDGKISVERKDVSGAKLNNYTKGKAELPLAATDTINQAFSKIEVSIENNEETTSAALNNINAKIDTEIAARKAVDGQSGDTYAANAKANYISAATSLNDADVKLDAALKGVSGKVDGIKYNVSGTTLIISGISQDSTLS